jgi:uncharacterized protein (TIGR02246 family)
MSTSTSTTQDERSGGLTGDPAVDELLDRYLATWRDDDMEAWGRLFTEDADFVTHTGVWWRSRHENVVGHQAVPDDIARQKVRYGFDAAEASAVAPDVALVHATWRWPGFVASPGDPPADRSGVVTMVLVARDGRWLIRSSHNTRTA